MSKLIHFGLLFKTLSILTILFVSNKGIEGVRPYGIHSEFAECVRVEFLHRSNFYRQKYKIEPQKITKETNMCAQEWANSLARSSEFHHEQNFPALFGHTITMSTQMFPNIGATIVDFWYSLVAFVRDGKATFDNKLIGPMTQMLWKSSKEIGVGVSQSENGIIYVVIYYSPKGNEEHFYHDNLPWTFAQSDIDDGKFLLNLHYLKMKSLHISHSNTGLVILPHVDIDLNARESPSMKLIEHFYSIKKSIGFSDYEASRIRKRILVKSNSYRQYHNTTILHIKSEMNDYAQDWANHLAFTGGVKDRPEKWIYGENKYDSILIAFCDFAELAVDVWYTQIGFVSDDMSESQFYRNVETGSLTQLLWKESKEIGVGVAMDVHGKNYIVVNYNPAGNIEGFYKSNLPEFHINDIKAGKKARDRLNRMAGFTFNANILT